MRALRDWNVLIAAVTLLLPSGTLAQTSPPETEQRTVVTDKSAFIALPPELVAEPVVTDLTVSGGGRYALAQRTRLMIRPEMLEKTDPFTARPQAENSLVLWDSRAHLRTTVWQADREEMSIDAVTWLPTAEVAFVKAYQTVPVHPDQPQGEKTTRPALLRIAPSNGRAEVVDLTALGRIEMLYFVPSPTVPLALVRASGMDGSRLSTSIHILDANGRFTVHADLPQGASASAVLWARNDLPLIHIAQRSPNSKGTTLVW